MKVLIADPISKHGLSILSDSGLDLIIKADSSLDEKISVVKDVDGIIIRSGTKVDYKMLQIAENLKVIGRAGVGIDNIEYVAFDLYSDKILDFKDNEKFITCDYTYFNDVFSKDEDLFPLAATALRRLEKLTTINKKISNETISTIKQLKDPSQIADNIASHISASISEKQQIFETNDVKKRLNAIIKIMENETSIIGVEKRIRGRVKTQMEKTQREYYLNEQLKAIQKELGEIEDGKDETTRINKAITKAKMPKDVEKKCLQELKKLKNMSPMSAEATVVLSLIHI